MFVNIRLRSVWFEDIFVINLLLMFRAIESDYVWFSEICFFCQYDNDSLKWIKIVL